MSWAARVVSELIPGIRDTFDNAMTKSVAIAHIKTGHRALDECCLCDRPTDRMNEAGTWI